MPPHHPAIAALAEQRQADLRHDAGQARLERSYRLARRPPVGGVLPAAGGCWRSAQPTPEQRRRGGPTMWVEFFVDPASGWTYWTSPSLTETEPRTDEDPTGATQRPTRQGLPLRLLGRVGVWFGICAQTPSGAWRRVRTGRRDPWDPGARHSTVWSWWCR